jgi:hypothetical protein
MVTDGLPWGEDVRLGLSNRAPRYPCEHRSPSGQSDEVAGDSHTAASNARSFAVTFWPEMGAREMGGLSLDAPCCASY